jgi:tetratricopeptide (TPR) repeat protein
MIPPPPDPKPLAAELAAIRDRAQGAERRLYERMLSLYQLAQDPQAAPEHLVAGSLTVLREWAKLLPDDAAVQAEVAKSVFQAGATLDALGLEGQKLRDEGLLRAKEGVARFPRAAQAWGALGYVSSQLGDDPVGALRTLAKCLALDPSEPTCKKLWDANVAAWSRPRCPGAELKPGLALYGAAPEAGGAGVRPVIWRARTYYLEREPTLSLADFAALADAGQGDLTVELTAEGRRKLEAMVPRAGAAERWAVLVAGEEPLVAAKLGAGAFTGTFVVSHSGLSLRRLCRAMERRELPADLRPAAPKSE